MQLKKFIILIMLILAIIVTINIKLNRDFIISKERIYYENLPSSFDGYKILQISDLHSNELGEKNSALIKTINQINPDIIMITGDIFSSFEMTNSDFDETKLPAYSLIKNLSTSHNIIYVTGNHEESVDVTFNNPNPLYRNRNINNAYNRYLDKLKQLGVTFVDDSYIELTKGNEHIYVYGIYYYTAEQITNNKFLNKYPLDKSNFNIILCHDPKYFEILANSGFDLILSGHIHGGIINLPLLGGLLSPDIELFPKYDKGLFKYNNSYLNVSSGLDTSRLIRINNPPEINLITLKK